MFLSLDESIQKLKTEIISQDWSLPPKKIEPLQAAFICLKNHFDTRKNTLAILSMADSILLYAQKRQDPVPPEFIDFLKEAMAHVVNMYEDENFDPDQDAELCKRVYGKFVRLREKVTTKDDAPPSPSGQEKESATELNPLAEPVFLDKSIADLVQNRSEHATATVLSEPAAAKAAETRPLPIQPEVIVRPITIGRLALAIAEKDIAIIKPLSPKMRKRYIKNKQIPLKELVSWFRSLSGQMQGPLALLKNGELKKLQLPLMIPKGIELADIPDEEANMLVVVSKGHRHGVIFCQLVQDATPLFFMAREKNDDIFGPAQLEEGQEVQLLNLNRLLRREGISLCEDKIAAKCRQPDHIKAQENKIMPNMRKNTRVPFQVVISLDFPDKSHVDCKTADLSLKGVFVPDITGHTIGENCLITLSLAGSTSHLKLRMKGTVIRVKQDGLALHFYEMDLDSFFHLKNILYYNSEDPDKLAEEISTQVESLRDKD